MNNKLVSQKERRKKREMVILEEYIAASLPSLFSTNELSGLFTSSSSSTNHADSFDTRLIMDSTTNDNHSYPAQALDPASSVTFLPIPAFPGEDAAAVRHHRRHHPQIFFPTETELPVNIVNPTHLLGSITSGGARSLFSSSEAESASSLGAGEWSAEQIVGVAVVAVIVPFILISNLLVILSVTRFKRLQMPTNYFIVSLAAVDIFVALVVPFVIVVEVLPGQVRNLVLCLAPNRILMTACGVSVLTLAAIAYDRHTALVRPLKYVSVMTIRKIATLVCLTWVYSAAIVWAPIPLGWYSRDVPDANVDALGKPHPCSFKLLHDSAHILFLSAIVGPACVAITVCYCRIYAVARHHARAIAAVESSVHHNLRMRFMIKDAKYAKTLALVIGVFLVLWTPYLTCLLVDVLAEVHVSPWMWNYLTLLAVLNSGLNPWIYAFKNYEFRTAFRKIFKACCCCTGTKPHCLNFHSKDTRRPSSLSDTNTCTTTTSSQSRISRLSRGSVSQAGRLSDVSCVVVEDVADNNAVNKIINIKAGDTIVDPATILRGAIPLPSLSVPLRRDSLVLHPPRTSSDACLPDSHAQKTLLRGAVDTKAFITNLLSMHGFNHSIIIAQNSSLDADESCVGEGGKTDQCDCREIDCRCELKSSHDSEHRYHSDHSDYHSDDQGEHSDHMSQSEASGHDDHSDDRSEDHCYHSDHSGNSIDTVSTHFGALYQHSTL